MENIGIIMWNVGNHRNQVVFKEMQPNPFLIIEKSFVNNRFKLNFDGSIVQNISVLGWVIRDSNSIIKMVACRQIGNSSIIVAECMVLRYDILAVKKKGFLNLEIEGD